MEISQIDLIAAIMRAKQIDTFYLPERCGIAGGYYSLAEIRKDVRLQIAVVRELRKAGFPI